ncbi:hypothetical protein ACPCIR_05455 [Mycobacterium sp. NPDC051198]
MANRRCVYKGDIPGDLYYGQWPDRLTITVEHSEADGLSIHGYDSVTWPVQDMKWEYRIAPEQTKVLRAAMNLSDADDITEALARLYENGRIPIRDLGGWLEKYGVQFSSRSEFFDN